MLKTTALALVLLAGALACGEDLTQPKPAYTASKKEYPGYWVDTIKYHANPDFLGLGNLPMDGCVEVRLTRIFYDAIYDTVLVHQSVGSIACQNPAHNRGFFTIGPINYDKGSITYVMLLDDDFKLLFYGVLQGDGSSILGSAIFSTGISSALVGYLRSHRLAPTSIADKNLLGMLAKFDQPFFQRDSRQAVTLLLPTPP